MKPRGCLLEDLDSLMELCNFVVLLQVSQVIDDLNLHKLRIFVIGPITVDLIKQRFRFWKLSNHELSPLMFGDGAVAIGVSVIEHSIHNIQVLVRQLRSFSSLLSRLISFSRGQ